MTRTLPSCSVKKTAVARDLHGDRRRGLQIVSTTQSWTSGGAATSDNVRREQAEARRICATDINVRRPTFSNIRGLPMVALRRCYLLAAGLGRLGLGTHRPVVGGRAGGAHAVARLGSASCPAADGDGLGDAVGAHDAGAGLRPSPGRSFVFARSRASERLPSRDAASRIGRRSSLCRRRIWRPVKRAAVGEVALPWLCERPQRAAGRLPVCCADGCP